MDRSATQALLQFIDQSPTAFQAVDSAVRLLETAGFSPLEEGDAWNLQAGKGYYVTRNRSAIIAFRMPTEGVESFLIGATHTDSPMFKVKPEPHAPSGSYLRLNTEVYGGTILSSWLDRPLSLAGRVILEQDGAFVSRSWVCDRDLLLIPNVAIHMNRAINGEFKYNPAVDLLPLFSMEEGRTLPSFVAAELGVREEEIAGMDLYVYNRMKGTFFGAGGEFFAAPRIDNLMCTYGVLRGMLEAQNDRSVQLFYAADNEETGSATKQGAASRFLSDVIDRIAESAGADRRRLLASSMMVSADNGHARHPNHPELSDAKNAPMLGGGVVIKSNAAQKYTTDAVSAAVFSAICKRAGVPVQLFSNRSDMPGGSTLGSISNTVVPLMTVDIGMAQLAMHSAYESAGTVDTAHLIAAMRAFFASDIRVSRDGSVSIGA